MPTNAVFHPTLKVSCWLLAGALMVLMAHGGQAQDMGGGDSSVPPMLVMDPAAVLNPTAQPLMGGAVVPPAAPVVQDEVAHDPKAAVERLRPLTDEVWFEFVGDKTYVTVDGLMTDDRLIDLTKTKKLHVVSKDPAVAQVKVDRAILVTAVGVGETDLDITYGQLATTIHVSVPETDFDDLNRVAGMDMSDVNLLEGEEMEGKESHPSASIAPLPEDASDLNLDALGMVKNRDLSHVSSKATSPRTR